MPPAVGLLSASPYSPVVGRRTLRLFASQDHRTSIISHEKLCSTDQPFHSPWLSGGPVCTKPIREVMEFFPRSTSYKLWSDMVDVVVPLIGESITDGTLATFLKKPGDRVKVDEPISQMKLTR
ncbi:hypothetical protein ZIOFF_000788 [Zingiber officinale]|uniref:Lipoyl-binding domain-containing protein n=1 Tax=Zingiber officinale TaxID=94328 RepID=A0A8J5IIA9_ZINOF|nr:hypothetical protein ZIOFF_000788 [Zingiber officinale]